jgi:hypothetical protein
VVLEVVGVVVVLGEVVEVVDGGGGAVVVLDGSPVGEDVVCGPAEEEVAEGLAVDEVACADTPPLTPRLTETPTCLFSCWGILSG